MVVVGRDQLFSVGWQIATDGNPPPNAVQVTSCRIAVSRAGRQHVDSAQRLAALLRQPRGIGSQTTRSDREDPQPRHAGAVGQRVGNAIADSTDPALGAIGPVGMKLRDLPDIDFAALNAKAAKLPTRSWRFEPRQCGADGERVSTNADQRGDPN
jgi:hypothetical protein